MANLKMMNKGPYNEDKPRVQIPYGGVATDS